MKPYYLSLKGSYRDDPQKRAALLAEVVKKLGRPVDLEPSEAQRYESSGKIKLELENSEAKALRLLDGVAYVVSEAGSGAPVETVRKLNDRDFKLRNAPKAQKRLEGAERRRKA